MRGFTRAESNEIKLAAIQTFCQATLGSVNDYSTEDYRDKLRYILKMIERDYADMVQ